MLSTEVLMDWTTREVRANGLRFVARELGEGPLALLLHGFPDTPHGFDHLGRALADAGLRVVAPFMRGYHPTEAPPRFATLDDLSGDALALIEALGHDRAELLVGHDWGAATAYAAAGLRPDRVGALVAVAMPHPAGLRPSLRQAWVGRHFWTLRLPGAARWLRRGGIRALVERWSPTWAFDSDELAPAEACLAEPGSAEAAIGYYRAFRFGRPVAGFRPRIAVPTLAVAGVDDPGFPLEAYERARRRFVGAYDVVALPGGHFVHRESPERFAQTVLDLLGAERLGASAVR